ncbi:MAG TPA: DUF4124 domain-containing protein [Cupriavidus sp.]|nr:DUF4124 domain-containing protein [Cupriavidus sp.]
MSICGLSCVTTRVLYRHGPPKELARQDQLANQSREPCSLLHKANMRGYFAVAIFVMATNAAGQTIYQCRNAAGHVTLQDGPCQSDARTETVSKSIGQRNAEYRAEPSSIFDPKGQARLTSSIICPSLRQSYQAAVANSERAMLSRDSAQIQQASEAVQRAGAQVSKYRCE